MNAVGSLAILVDGDNIASAYAGQILRKTEELGSARIRRVYCNQSSLADWSVASSFLAVHSGAKENASDILLSIDAVRFALQDGIETFVIISSDRDLSHVAHALREMGRYVVGIGDVKAPKEFRFACSEFRELQRPTAKVANEELDEIDKALRTAFDTEDPDGRGILLKDINSRVRKYLVRFKISESSDKTWPAYFKNRPKLYSIIGEGQDKRVLIARDAG